MVVLIKAQLIKKTRLMIRRLVPSDSHFPPEQVMNAQLMKRRLMIRRLVVGRIRTRLQKLLVQANATSRLVWARQSKAIRVSSARKVAASVFTVEIRLSTQILSVSR
jgi:hypothetical protein